MKRLEREAGHAPPPTAVVNNALSFTPLPHISCFSVGALYDFLSGVLWALQPWRPTLSSSKQYWPTVTLSKTSSLLLNNLMIHPAARRIGTHSGGCKRAHNRLDLYSGSRRFESKLTEIFLGLPQSLEANAQIPPRLDHGRILPSSFQFIVHESSFHWLYSLDTDNLVK